jgi:dihydroneopterin aldolase
MSALRDLIQVKNLRVSAILGVNESERVAKQALVITLSLSTDVGSTASQDALATAFNYSTVTKVVTNFVEKSAYFTLEALAVAIARVLVVDLGVPLAKVRVEKPEALG